jgi:hypothetical protein
MKSPSEDSNLVFACARQACAAITLLGLAPVTPIARRDGPDERQCPSEDSNLVLTCITQVRAAITLLGLAPVTPIARRDGLG